MNLWQKLTGTTEQRAHRDRMRKSREIRAIDKNTANWLRNGGLNPRKKTL